MAAFEEIPDLPLTYFPMASLPLSSNPTDSIAGEQISAIRDQINAAARHQSGFVADPYRGSARYTQQRPLDEDNQPYADMPMKDLTEVIAHTIYYNRSAQIGPEGGILNLEAHKDFIGGDVIAEYEPISQLFEPQLKIMLEQLGPIVRTTGDVSLKGLRDFVRNLLILKKKWFKAAGAFFGLLAYMDMLETWGIKDGGVSFPGEHGEELIQWELGKTQIAHENAWRALSTFKSTAAFEANINKLHNWFDSVITAQEESMARAKEREKNAEEANKKRMAVRNRNVRAIRHQMGQGPTCMGINRQMHLVASHAETIHRAMEMTEDVEEGHWA